MKLYVCLICFIFGYKVSSIFNNSKKDNLKENLQLKPPLEETYEQKKIKELQKKLKDEQLKSSYYITVINEIEKELKNQQFNSIINLINKVKTIISPQDNYNIDKRKELTKTATNEND